MKIQKKTIAREFLLLTGCIVISLLAIFGTDVWNSYHNHKIKNLGKSAEVVLNEIEAIKQSDRKETDNQDKTLIELREKRDRIWRKKDQIRVLISDPQDKFKLSLYIFWCLIFIVFPVRYLTLGVIWSIKTLRAKQ